MTTPPTIDELDLDSTLGTFAGYVEMAFRAKTQELSNQITKEGLSQAKTALRALFKKEMLKLVGELAFTHTDSEDDSSEEYDMEIIKADQLRQAINGYGEGE